MKRKPRRTAARPVRPELPTDALPGTTAKVRVLEARARLGLPLFDPRDARIPRGDTPADRKARKPRVPRAYNTANLDATYRKFLDDWNEQLTEKEQ